MGTKCCTCAKLCTDEQTKEVSIQKDGGVLIINSTSRSTSGKKTSSSLYSNSPMENHGNSAVRDEKYENIQAARIQGIWRKYKEKKEYEKYYTCKYFTTEEIEELCKNNWGREEINLLQIEGIYKFKNGSTYKGEWKNKERSGFGSQIYKDGAKYIGEWECNKAKGSGIFTHNNGDTYQGEWLHNKAHGYGSYKTTRREQYEGMWENDMHHGVGLEQFHDESIYEGEYIYGRKEGLGVYTWKDGSLYSGFWVNNVIMGIGTYYWGDGRRYVGEWVDNAICGVGVYTWGDGREYMGGYRDDLKEGFGHYTWGDGREYVGGWRGGRRFGLARCIGVDHTIEYGLWENGKRIKIFTETEVEKINLGLLDYRVNYTLQSDYSLPLEIFQTPQGFYERIKCLTNQISNLEQDIDVWSSPITS